MKRLSEGIYPGLLCALLIMVLMALPGECFPTVVTFWEWLGPDKIIHSLLFAALAFLSLWGFRKKIHSEPHKRNMIFILTFFITIAYGGVTEILQKHLFVNRYGSILDFLADAIGCVLGLSIFILCFKKKLKK